MFLWSRIATLLADLIYFLVAYFLKNGEVRFELSQLNLILTLASLFLPFILNASESWANAIFDTLFDHLMLEDFNKNLESLFAPTQFGDKNKNSDS